MRLFVIWDRRSCEDCAFWWQCRWLMRVRRRPSITEKIEWTWTDRPENPVGRAAQCAAGGRLDHARILSGDGEGAGRGCECVSVCHSASSGDPRLPGQLRDYFAMMGIKFAVIHFNNGMHGWGYTEQEYASGLPGMIAALRDGAPHAALVWASTTPVLHDSVRASRPMRGSTNAIAWQRRAWCAKGSRSTISMR